MLEPAAPGGAGPRAFLRVGGITVARQQLALALALRCERIVCIAHGLSAQLIELQHLAEGQGAQFNVIPGPRLLAGLITANDELLVLADGLFASTAETAALLEQGQAVLVQPIDQGLAAGFERIDLNHAAAGAMRIPGRLVERIADLPPDCDAASSLQRIALQSGLRQVPIPGPGQEALFWTLVRNDDEAHAIEPQWIRQRTQDSAPLGPSRWLARLAVRRLGPALLHAGSGARTLAVAAAALVLLALGTGWLHLVTLGLWLCALGWILNETAVLLARIEADPVSTPRRLDSRTAYGWICDAVLIVLAAWGSLSESGQPAFHRYFPAFMLLALLRMLPRNLGARSAVWLEDRAILGIGLSLAVGAGWGWEAIHLAAIVAAVLGILVSGPVNRLTRP